MSLFKKKTRRNQQANKTVFLDERVLNSASTLLTNIQFSSVDRPYRTIAVTSTAPNEGKTTVSLSLAAVVGRQGMRCLLVECDMRRRSLSKALDIRTRPCMYDLLKGTAPASAAICATPLPGVSLLDVEHGIPHPDALIRSESFKNMLDRLEEKFDYIILDTPPVLAYPDASIAASLADATVLVSRIGYVQKKSLVIAADQMNAVGANLIGAVVNDGDSRSMDAYDYYYEEAEPGNGAGISVPSGAPTQTQPAQQRPVPQVGVTQQQRKGAMGKHGPSAGSGSRANR